MEGRTAQFIPTFDAYEQSLSIIARAGNVSPFGQSDIVPFYDRFYLGGPDTLRGFDYREVGNRDDDDPNESVGGNSYAFVSLEYGFRIAEPLGLVVFYDWGFVNENDFDFSMSEYADNWGVGARIMLMGSPLGSTRYTGHFPRRCAGFAVQFFLLHTLLVVQSNNSTHKHTHEKITTFFASLLVRAFGPKGSDCWRRRCATGPC